MSLHQSPNELTHAVSSDGALPGGIFLAGLAVGVAPAVAAAGYMLNAHLLAFGVTSGLLVMGFVTAALSSDT
jgi:hypothetical protein